MVFNIETGQQNKGIRKEVIDGMVKQTAARAYKFKQAVAIVTTNAWKNTFFREDLTVLTGRSGNSQKGIPRGANFPQRVVKWQEVSVRVVKHGLEDNIIWEDIISGEINVQARTVIRLTEGVVKSVDDDIFNQLSQAGITNNNPGQGTNIVIQSFALGNVTDGGNWDQSSAAIIDNLMKASQLIAENGNYAVNDLMCFVSPRDKRSIMKFLADKGAQWMPIATDIATNGRIATVAGVTIVESTSVPASYALVVKPKVCATWKSLVPLTSTTIEDPFKSVKIRVVEEGVVELTDPQAIVLIKGTQLTKA